MDIELEQLQQLTADEDDTLSALRGTSCCRTWSTKR
jgi:hypothetical protein